MTSIETALEPGAQVQLQFPKRGEERHLCRLVGVMPEVSILATTPRHQGAPIPVRMGWPLVVRFFANQNIFAFTSEVLNVCTHPFPYLHLSYPHDYESGAVRRAARVRCSIDTTITLPAAALSEPAATPLKGRLVDISVEGLRLELPSDDLPPGQHIELSAELPVGRYRELLRLTGVVRSKLDHVISKDMQASYGVELVTVERSDYLALYGFVNAQLAETGGG